MVALRDPSAAEEGAATRNAWGAATEIDQFLPSKAQPLNAPLRQAACILATVMEIDAVAQAHCRSLLKAAKQAMGLSDPAAHARGRTYEACTGCVKIRHVIGVAFKIAVGVKCRLPPGTKAGLRTKYRASDL